MITKFKEVLSKSKYFVKDPLEVFLGLRDPIVPPNRFLKPREVRNNDFILSGQRIVSYLKNNCDLRPTSRVLDVGYRFGRLAIPLTKYLSEQGSYEGIDVHEGGYAWCHRHITPRHPNFKFQLLNVKNQFYRPQGEEPASKFRFPFPDNSFDLVILFSVFTHMKPDDVENYFSEIKRVLKVGGRSFITYLLINPETIELVKQGKAIHTFEHDFGVYCTPRKDCPERVLAYKEEWVVDLYRRYGMPIEDKIHYGRWRGLQKTLTHQDLIVSIKPDSGGNNL